MYAIVLRSSALHVICYQSKTISRPERGRSYRREQKGVRVHFEGLYVCACAINCTNYLNFDVRLALLYFRASLVEAASFGLIFCRTVEMNQVLKFTTSVIVPFQVSMVMLLCLCLCSCASGCTMWLTLA